MARVFYWLTVSILGFALILFAVNNHGNVAVSLWPFLETSLTVPLHSLLLFGVIVGFVIGVVVGWMQGDERRRRGRELARRAEADQRRIAALQEEVEGLKAAEQRTAIPASPSRVG